MLRCSSPLTNNRVNFWTQRILTLRCRGLCRCQFTATILALKMWDLCWGRCRNCWHRMVWNICDIWLFCSWIFLLLLYIIWHSTSEKYPYSYWCGFIVGWLVVRGLVMYLVMVRAVLTGRWIGSGFDLAWFSSLFSERLCISSLHGTVCIKNFSLHF